MFKVYVMIVGLIALVPHKDASGKITSLTALILDAPSGTKYSWNEDFPSHQPQRRIYFVSSPTPVLNLAGHQMEIKAPAAVPPHGIPFPTALPILNLQSVFTAASYSASDMPTLRPECFTINPANPCKDSRGNNLLAGVATFSGDWSISSVEINFSREPFPAVVDTSQYTFMAVDSPGTIIPYKTQLSGAILLSADLSNESDLLYKENGVSYTLGKGACPFSNGATQCMLIVLINLPVHSMPCRDITEFDRVDQHFDRMFELFNYPGSPTAHPKRFLPYVLWRDQPAIDALCPRGSAGDPPAIKCPSAFVSN